MILSVMWIGLWKDRFDFKHTNHRKETDEKQEQGCEEPERADKCANINPSRMEHSPCGWHEIAGQCRRDDDEALEPHSHVWELNDDPDPY